MKLEEKGSLFCEISAWTLAKIIAEGVAAASQPTDFPRYMGTCLLKTSEGNLIAASTDGKRLAVAKAPCEQIKREEEIVVSAPEVKELGKSLASNHAAENIRILVSSSTVWFQLENNDKFPIDRLDITFPKYGRILNDTIHTSMKINQPDLLAAIDKINLIAAINKPAHVMVMALNPNNNEATLSASHPDYGAIHETLHAEIKESYLQVGFNINFFLDGLKAAGNNSIVIEFSGDEGQARIKRENDNSFLYLIMPVRLTAADILNENDFC